MRILYVIDSLGTGGAEVFLCELAKHLVEQRGADVFIVTLYPADAERWRIEGTRVGYTCLGVRGKWTFPLAGARLREIARELQPDVIHVHLFPADVLTALTFHGKELPGVPLLFTEHSEWNRRRSSAAFKLLDGWTYNHFDRILCVSELVRERLVEWLPSTSTRALVRANAVMVPAEPWREPSPPESDLLVVGRLVREKGIDILLRAQRLLYERGLRVSLKIAGAGPLQTRLEALARKLEVAERVTFLGKRKDVAELMRRSRLLILPSRWEGMPMVLLEGMALGIPVVATRISGASSLIESGHSGMLVEPESPPALAEAIEQCLTQPGLGAALGVAARRRIQTGYSLDAYGKELMELYARAQENSRERGRAR